jgi:hypothetical protein
MRCALVIGLMVATLAAQVCYSVSLESLREDRWVLMFAVAPGCPACQDAIAWLGGTASSQPLVSPLILGPSLTSALERLAADVDLPVAIDEDGTLSNGMGVERAPTVICLLDGRPVARLDWPFGEGDLAQKIDELASLPRLGPWQHLGATVSLGTASTLGGGTVLLDDIRGPWVLSFYSVNCSSCSGGLSLLLALSEEVQLVLAVLGSDELPASERAALEKAGVTVVQDNEGTLSQKLGVRVTPTHVLMTPAGKVGWATEGPLEDEALRAAISASMGEDAADTDVQQGGSP